MYRRSCRTCRRSTDAFHQASCATEPQRAGSRHHACRHRGFGRFADTLQAMMSVFVSLLLTVRGSVRCAQIMAADFLVVPPRRFVCCSFVLVILAPPPPFGTRCSATAAPRLYCSRYSRRAITTWLSSMGFSSRFLNPARSCCWDWVPSPSQPADTRRQANSVSFALTSCWRLLGFLDQSRTTCKVR
jgi:hypothetical protein